MGLGSPRSSAGAVGGGDAGAASTRDADRSQAGSSAVERFADPGVRCSRAFAIGCSAPCAIDEWRRIVECVAECWQMDLRACGGASSRIVWWRRAVAPGGL